MRRGLIVVCLMGATVGCEGGALDGGAARTGGTGGATATAGTSGAAGAAGGTAGTGSTAGATGTGGTAVGGGPGSAGTGAAGTGGTAGAPGASGAAGTAGIGGSPACIADGKGDRVEFAIVGADAMLIGAPATATVSVASIDSCAQVTCPTFSTVSSGWISTAASRFTLTAPGPQQWTVYLRDSAMPTDLIKVGDAFDLTIAAGGDSTFYQQNLDQTMVLSRDGNLILFAAGLSRSFQLATPNLEAFGVQVSDAGAFPCQNGQNGFWGAVCTVRPHAASVAVGGETATLGGGQTSTIGWLSFTNASFTELDDPGGCDALSATIMAGFRSP